LILVSFSLILSPIYIYSSIIYTQENVNSFNPDIAVVLGSGTAGVSEISVNGTSAIVNVTAAETHDFVDNNVSDVDTSADKGTHSNFTAQQYSDTFHDTLMEEQTQAGAGTFEEELGVNGFTNADADWTEVGDSPYLGAIDYASNYIWGSVADGWTEGRFNFTDGSGSGTLNDVKICVYATQDSGDDGHFYINLYNSTGGPYLIVDYTPSAGSWAWSNTSCLNTLSSWSEINSGQLEVVAYREAGPDVMYVDAALVWVNYTIPEKYELDLEVQWTDADYDETNEELAIYVEKGDNTHSLDATGGYMIIGDGTPDWGSTTGTISFWVKMDASVQGRFYGQDGNMETRWSGTNLLLDWGATGSMTSAYSFSADTWYFVAIVWDENNNNLFLYVGDENNAPALDGNSLSGTWTSTTPPPTENRFMNGLGGSEPVDGHGDDLRYWNITKSLAELQSDYNKTLSGSETNLRSYFKLNNNFDDIGPDNNDGSASGSYSFSSDVPFDSPPTENIRVDVWNGAAWQNLFTDLTNGWNNVSVSAYLTFSNFTIRFKGDTETGDTDQDRWDIDVALLHVWTHTYDYILNVTSQKTYDQNITLNLYNYSNIDRLSNCTIWFSDGTTSVQINITNGIVVQDVGPWYLLPASETRYIEVYVEESASGTSVLFIRLEAVKASSIVYTCLIKLTVK